MRLEPVRRAAPHRAARLNPAIAQFVRAGVLSPTQQTFGEITSEAFSGTFCSAVGNAVDDGEARQGVSSVLFDTFGYRALSTAERAGVMSMCGLISGWTNTAVSRVLTPSGTGFPVCAIYSAYTAPNRFVQAQHQAASGATVTCVHPTVIEPGKLYAVEVNWQPGVELAIWVNGLKASTSTGATGVYSSATTNSLVNPAGSTTKYPYHAAAFLPGTLLGGAFSEDPSILFAPRRIWVPVMAAGGAIDLAIDDATHGHSAGNLALTQVHALAVADALHAHSAENLTLAVATTLAIADAAHAHGADNLALSQVHDLAVAAAVHAHAADALTLTQAHVLAIADAVHPHAADNIDLSGAVLLAIASAMHDHSADNLVLTQAHELAVDGVTHAHSTDTPSLTQAHLLSVADATHAHAADGITLTVGGVTLAIADAQHAHSLANIDLSQVHILTISDAAHAHLADVLALSLPGVVLPDDRVLVIAGEKRVLVIAAESRALEIAAEVRSLTIH